MTYSGRTPQAVHLEDYAGSNKPACIWGYSAKTYVSLSKVLFVQAKNDGQRCCKKCLKIFEERQKLEALKAKKQAGERN